ncbi:Putative ribosomal N-acetyltransferase YdaF [Corynebacterium ciconiae DSM 44920]|nr:Putative ribosomal N-acetyltransferase YdaF [Corynebacterium ciconiae DSM 44920]
MTWPYKWKELTGTKVKLRGYSTSDIEDMLVTGNDPDTQRFTTVPHPYGRQQAESFVDMTQHDDSGMYWVITDAGDTTARYMGQIDLRNVEQGLYLSFGYLTAPWARGKGLMTDAVRTVSQFAFDHGALRLEIRAIADNGASRRVAEKTGFTFEGVLRRALFDRDRFRDCAVYSLLAGE